MGNPAVAKLVLCPYDKDLDMAMIFEVITMLSALALGFVLGRIWEIRQGEISQRLDDNLGFRIPTAHLPSHLISMRKCATRGVDVATP